MFLSLAPLIYYNFGKCSFNCKEVMLRFWLMLRNCNCSRKRFCFLNFSKPNYLEQSHVSFLLFMLVWCFALKWKKKEIKINGDDREAFVLLFLHCHIITQIPNYNYQSSTCLISCNWKKKKSFILFWFKPPDF